MNSFERVRAALQFSGPDRIPVMNFMSLYTLLFKSDVLPFGTTAPKSWQPGWNEGEEGLFPHFTNNIYVLYKWKKPGWAKDPKYKNWQNQPHEEIDEWGCIWINKGDNSSMGHPQRASLTDWSKLDGYIDKYFLNPEDKSRYRLAGFEGKLFGRNKYRMPVIGVGPFTIASNMRGFTPYLIDHKKNPENVKDLLERITNILVKQMKMYGKVGVKPHGFLLYEDLATQFQPYMSPTLFKEIYESAYRSLIDTAHDLGCEFHHHCCGKIDKLIPLLIEWGIDALELDSPRMTGYPDLNPFRGKIMFWACVNIQSIYIRGTPNEVEREVWHMNRNLGTPNGGFGAYYYPQYYHIQVPKENIKAFEKGIQKYGNYSKIPPSWWDCPVVAEWKDKEVPPLPPLKLNLH